MKKVSALSEEGKRDEALAEAKAATSLLDKAMIHGTLHKNTVRRIISRMHKNINSATANN
ncbi:UNVERIFIED_CONTAM: hypothetical protein GTU68_021156 [Idotea baltica]|nr:hypothetical protein [Idotea baltica]